MAADTPETPIFPVEPPFGMYSARMDDKGRIKLPVDFQTFFGALPEKKVFVTSLDGVTGHIYPIAVWRENLKLMATSQEDPEVVSDVLFNANDLGAATEIDSSGRLMVCSEMREAMDLAGQELHLLAVKGHVEILTHAVFMERRKTARPAADDNGKRKATANVRLLEQKGLQ